MIAAAGAIIVSLIAYDFAINDRDLLAKDRVDWTLFGLVRPFVALVSACLLVVALFQPGIVRTLVDDGQAALLIGATWLMPARCWRRRRWQWCRLFSTRLCGKGRC